MVRQVGYLHYLNVHMKVYESQADKGFKYSAKCSQVLSVCCEAVVNGENTITLKCCSKSF